MAKKFSIVIPTYNHLEDCLRPCTDWQWVSINVFDDPEFDSKNWEAINTYIETYKVENDLNYQLKKDIDPKEVDDLISEYIQKYKDKHVHPDDLTLDQLGISINNWVSFNFTAIHQIVNRVAKLQQEVNILKGV